MSAKIKSDTVGPKMKRFLVTSGAQRRRCPAMLMAPRSEPKEKHNNRVTIECLINSGQALSGDRSDGTLIEFDRSDTVREKANHRPVQRQINSGRPLRVIAAAKNNTEQRLRSRNEGQWQRWDVWNDPFQCPVCVSFLASLGSHLTSVINCPAAWSWRSLTVADSETDLRRAEIHTSSSRIGISTTKHLERLWNFFFNHENQGQPRSLSFLMLKNKRKTFPL